MTYEKRRVLITVKTYPTPSKKSNETVCTAGITENGEWIRLYPIPYRYLNGEQKFRIFDWIEVSVAKRDRAKDHRPESYSVERETIQVLNHLDAQKDLANRFAFIQPLIKSSLEEVIEEHTAKGTSLAVICPQEMQGLSFEATDADWSSEQITCMNQISFFETQDEVAALKKVPYKIHCHFRCNHPECKGHKLLLTSWEYNWTLVKLLEQYPDDHEKAKRELQDRWIKHFHDDRVGCLFLGTVNSNDRFHTFIAIGHCSFPKYVLQSGEQLSLF